MTESTTRTWRTLVQGAVALAAAAPLLVAASGVPEHTAGIAVFVAVSAAITRVMALPVIDALLPAWLRVRDPDPGGDPEWAFAPEHPGPASGEAPRSVPEADVIPPYREAS